MIKINCSTKLCKVLEENNIDSYGPSYNGESAGLDLYNCGSDVIIKSIHDNENQKTLISTGIRMLVPKGYVALVQERGSITKSSLKVRAGVIDSGYTGEVFVNLVNLSKEDKIIYEGEKLPVQIVTVKCDNHYECISEEEYINVSSDARRKEGKIGSSD
jgi:deoxyuridine 5'-triphosphate nucleotidohydrolase